MLVRNLRLTALLWELEDFRKIAATFDRFSKPFLTIMFSLYTVMFFYAIIGEFFFEGVITVSAVQDANIGASDLYFLINFNDMYASMITLFHVLVVNNWNQTTDMYCTICESHWPRVYFSTYWVICTLIMLNIVISFVLEIYGSIGDEIEVEARKKRMARNLMKYFKTDEDGSQLGQFVHECAVEEARLKYGLNFDADDFVHMVTSRDYCEDKMKTFKGRRNSLDQIYSPEFSNRRERSISVDNLPRVPAVNHTLSNTIGTSDDTSSKFIHVTPLHSGTGIV